MYNAKEIINVTYKRKHNPNRSTYQNQAKGIDIKTFKSKKAAAEFIKAVEVVHIFNGIGQMIIL